MSESQAGADEIFLTALELSSLEERSKYLDKVCGDNSDLRQRVQRLLDAHPEVGEFMESPAVDVAATVDQPEIAERPGTTIGRYKLLQQIGEGGFGVVFMAEQQTPVVRRVALKVIKPGMDTKEVVARFEAERQALALMNHPNIANVLDGGATDSGRPYFIMELVKGMPITDYCEQNELTVSERLDLFMSVCQAVHHAHQKGVIHRDLKPSNILVTLHDGTPVVKVIDFGVAKALNQRLTERTLFTKFAQIVGTPLYMSPEQAEMSGLDIDTRSDIYSLGVLLYELLTGSTPFDRERFQKAALEEIRRIIRDEEPSKPSTKISTLGGSAGTIAQHRKTDPKRLSMLLHGDLDWIVMKALEKDRTRRYETASDFAKDIERHLTDKPVEACPPSVAYRFRKYARRHKTQLAMVTTVSAILIVASLVSTCLAAWALRAEADVQVRLVGEQAARKDAQRNEARAKRSEKEANQLRTTAEWNLYIAQMRLAQGSWEAFETSRIHRMLDNYLPQPGQRDLRGWEWYYLLSLCRSNLLTLRGHTSSVDVVAWSPDGRRLASGGSDNTVRIWDGTTGQELLTLNGQSTRVSSIAWSSDGTRLAVGGNDKTVRIWNTTTGELALSLFGHARYARAVSWSADGRRLASGNDDGTVRIWDAMTGQELLTLKGHSDKVHLIDWNPDSVRLATASDDETVRIWDTATESQIRTFERLGVPTALAWSPDGQRLASASLGKFAVQIWHAASGRLVSTLKSGPKKSLGWSNVLAWSPDAQRMVVGSDYGFVSVWQVAPGQEVQESLVLAGHTNYVWSVAWHPDGSRIASAGFDRTIRVWDPNRSEDAVELPIPANPYNRLAWSPDGRCLASGSQDKTVVVWDWAMRKELLKLKGHTQQIRCVAWRPDGRLLASAGFDKTVKIWDSASGKEVKSFEGHTHEVGSVGWSPDGTRLASASTDGTVKIWDTATGREVHTLRGHNCAVHSVAWSPDGRRLATQAGSGSRRLRIWDAVSAQQILGVRNPRVGTTALGSVAWSPDGQRLATDGPNCSIQIWDANTGKEVSFLLGHKQSPSIAWQSSGQRIASGSADGTLRIWTADSLYEVLVLPGRGSPAWSPDGLKLASPAVVENDKVVRIWDASRGYGFAGQMEEYELDRGYRLLEASELDEAVSVFEKVARRFPGKANHRKALAGAHYERGAIALGLGNRNEGLRDLDEAIRLHPEFLQAINTRAVAYLKRGEYAAALPDLLKKWDIEYGTQKSVTGHWLALSYLATGDTVGYGRACAGMLQCFGNAIDPEEGRWLAWTCAIAPGAASDLTGAISCAELAAQSDASSIDALSALGALFYRAGRFEEATKRLTEATRLPHELDPGSEMTGRDRAVGRGVPQQPNSSLRPSYLYACYFLAMANQQYGQTEEAKKWYQEAVSLTQTALDDNASDSTRLAWDERVTLQLLRAETESLLHED